jgi:hypothetical protein
MVSSAISILDVLALDLYLTLLLPDLLHPTSSQR